MAEAELGAGHPAAALRHVERLLGADPWQEMAALIGMRACVEMKEPAQALRLYHRVESSLRQELGLEPQKELQDFFKLLSSGR